MTLIPNLLVAGALTVLLGSFLVIWSAGLVRRRFAGQILIAVSIALVLIGRGFIPTLMGIMAGVAALRIDHPPNWL